MRGVTLTPLKRIHTDKGDVLHALKATETSYCGFGEAYFSEILHGQIKGWKRHNRMTLNLIVVSGKVRFRIYDDRKDSPTCGETMVVELSPDDNYQRLTIEPHLWMSFEGVANQTSIILDIIPQPHDPQEADTKEYK